MAKVVGVFNVAHTPFCFMPPENWNAVRATRPIRADVPMDDLQASKDKSIRIANAFETLKAKLAEARADVIVIFGDDQMECFDFRNFPAFAVYVGEEFEGALSSPEALAHDAFDSVGRSREDAPDLSANAPAHTGPTRGRIQAHPALATCILRGLMARGFDPAFSMDMPKPAEGLGHAFMRPAETLTDLRTPIIPILMNCYFAPQPTGMRSYEFGKAVRAAIDEYPEDLRVVIVGSGGLWHTPGATNAYLDETFDRESLALMEKGDIRGMAEYFDNYRIPAGDTSQALTGRGPASTGMPAFSGPQGGTREICNWIAASAAMDGTPGVLVDYVPVYASPIGTAFAYWLS